MLVVRLISMRPIRPFAVFLISALLAPGLGGLIFLGVVSAFGGLPSSLVSSAFYYAMSGGYYYGFVPALIGSLVYAACLLEPSVTKHRKVIVISASGFFSGAWFIWLAWVPSFSLHISTIISSIVVGVVGAITALIICHIPIAKDAFRA